MDLGPPVGLHTHLQQVITYPLILLRPLLTPDPMIWCFRMLSLLSIRRKAPETPSQKCNPPGFPSNSCNHEFKCSFSPKLWSGQISVQSCQSLSWRPPALLVHPSKAFHIHGHYLPWQRLWDNGFHYDALNSLGEGQQSVSLERYKWNKWRSQGSST